MQLEEGWLEGLELLALFFLKMGICDSTLKTLESFSLMLYFAVLRFVSKREGQIQTRFDE